MPGGLPSASNTPERTARPLVTSCPAHLSSCHKWCSPHPCPSSLPSLGPAPGWGGHKGQETAGLAGVRQTRPGLGIPPSSLSDLSQLLLQVILHPFPSLSQLLLCTQILSSKLCLLLGSA